MGSYKWGYKSPKMAYKYSYPNYNPIYNFLRRALGFSVQSLGLV